MIPIWGYAAAGALLVGFAGGWQVRSWKCDSALTHALQRAEKDRARLQAQVERAATDYEAKRNDLQNATVERSTEIRTIYRDRPIRADCDIDPAARSLLDRARDNANSGITGKPVVPMPSITRDP